MGVGYMICCGEDLGRGRPIGMRSYWCKKCETEHLVDARDVEELLVKMQARIDELEQQADGVRLPNLL